MNLRPSKLLCVTGLMLAALPAATASAAPPIDLQPTSQDFGLIEVDNGGDGRQIQVQNNTGESVDIADTAIDGPGSDGFYVEWSNCPPTLGAWQGCTIAIRFAPTDMADYSATLRVQAGGSEATVALTGSGAMRRFTPHPNVLDFGSATVGGAVVRSVTMTNTGNLPFMSMVAIPTGGDVGAFRLLEDGCSLRVFMPSTGCKLKVRFEPFEADNAEATLAIIGQGDPITVTLRGVGVEPATPDSGDEPGLGAVKRKTGPPRVGFNWLRGLPAPYRNGRVDLGVARCEGAKVCHVTVRTRFVTTASRAAGVRTTRAHTSFVRLRGSRRLTIPLPRGLAGKPVRMVATMRIRAHRHPAGRQRLSMALVPGWREGPSLVVVRRAG